MEDGLADVLQCVNSERNKADEDVSFETMKANIQSLLKSDFDVLLFSRTKNAHRRMHRTVHKIRERELKSKPPRADRRADVAAADPEDTHAASKGGSVPSDDRSDEHMVYWEGSQHVKGQLLFRALFHICNKYVALMGPSSWAAVVRALLWCRRKGDLPESLVEIDDFSDAKGGPLDPSVYVVQCCHLPGYKALLEAHNKKFGTVAIRDQPAPSSGGGRGLWASVASLIWAPSGGQREEELGSSGSGLSVNASATGSFRLPYTGDSTGSRPQHHPLLKVTMGACRVDAILFNRIRELSEKALTNVICCIIDEIDGLYRPKYVDGARSSVDASAEPHFRRSVEDSSPKLSPSDSTNSLEKLGHKDGTGSEFSCESNSKQVDIVRSVTELDAVVVIEWMSRLMFANMQRARIVWSRLHGESVICLYHDMPVLIVVIGVLSPLCRYFGALCR